MARFSKLDVRFRPYSETSNAARSASVRQSAHPAFNIDTPRSPGLSVVVLNLNRPDLLRGLWDGFEQLTERFAVAGRQIEFLVGDTGSTDREALWLLNNPPQGTKVFRNLKYNFSSCNNFLANHAAYASILFLNNDVLINENSPSVELTYEVLRTSEYAIVSTVLKFADDLIQHAGVDFFRTPELYGFCYHPHAREKWVHKIGRTWEVGAATGAYLMMETTEFMSVGGFDEIYQSECQDVDLCLKFKRLGKKIGIIDTGRLVHLENATRPTGEENWHDRATYMRRWNSFVETL